MVYCLCLFFTKVVVFYSNKIVLQLWFHISFCHIADHTYSCHLESSFLFAYSSILLRFPLRAKFRRVYLLFCYGSMSVLSLSLLACSFLFLWLVQEHGTQGPYNNLPYINSKTNACCLPTTIYIIFLLSTKRICLCTDLNASWQLVK